MTCKKCGKPISTEYAFCPFCGKRTQDIKAGDRFGRLTVVEKTTIKPKYRQGAVYKCVCDCGNVTFVEGNLLRRGNTTSCGCRLTEIQQTLNPADILHHSIEGTKSDEAIRSMAAGNLYKNNTSGTMGVYYNKTTNRWVAKITFRRKTLCSYHKAKEDAVKQRKNWEAEFWGEPPILEGVAIE